MPPNSPYRFEICADTAAAIAASVGVADRIELCAGLDVGGLTPDIGMMEFAADSGIETHVLIRNRSGDFCMTQTDITVAVANIKAVKSVGLKGVVIGAERNGALDRRAIEAMINAADGLDVTIHRVVDVVDKPDAALELAIALGAVRILTSGAAKSAPDGTATLTRLHTWAAGRIEIMAGGGIKSTTLPALMAATPITSFHASCSKLTPLAARYSAFGFGDSERLFDHAEAAKIATILHRNSGETHA